MNSILAVDRLLSQVICTFWRASKEDLEWEGMSNLLQLNLQVSRALRQSSCPKEMLLELLKGNGLLGHLLVAFGGSRSTLAEDLLSIHVLLAEGMVTLVRLGGKEETLEVRNVEGCLLRIKEILAEAMVQFQGEEEKLGKLGEMNGLLCQVMEVGEEDREKREVLVKIRKLLDLVVDGEKSDNERETLLMLQYYLEQTMPVLKGEKTDEEEMNERTAEEIGEKTVEETSVVTLEETETSEVASKETNEKTAEENGEKAVEETSEVALEETNEKTAEDVGEKAVEETSEVALEETNEKTAEDVGENAVEETSEVALKKTNQKAVEETNEVVKEETSKEELEETNLVVKEDPREGTMEDLIQKKVEETNQKTAVEEKNEKEEDIPLASEQEAPKEKATFSVSEVGNQFDMEREEGELSAFEEDKPSGLMDEEKLSSATSPVKQDQSSVLEDENVVKVEALSNSEGIVKPPLSEEEDKEELEGSADVKVINKDNSLLSENTPENASAPTQERKRSSSEMEEEMSVSEKKRKLSFSGISEAVTVVDDQLVKSEEKAVVPEKKEEVGPAPEVASSFHFHGTLNLPELTPIICPTRKNIPDVIPVPKNFQFEAINLTKSTSPNAMEDQRQVSDKTTMDPEVSTCRRSRVVTPTRPGNQKSPDAPMEPLSTPEKKGEGDFKFQGTPTAGNSKLKFQIPLPAPMPKAKRTEDSPPDDLKDPKVPESGGFRRVLTGLWRNVNFMKPPKVTVPVPAAMNRQASSEKAVVKEEEAPDVKLEAEGSLPQINLEEEPQVGSSGNQKTPNKFLQYDVYLPPLDLY